MADKIWKNLEFNDKYHISNMGDVKSFCKNKNGIILKTNTHNMGYYSCYVGGKEYLVHRLVASVFLGLDIKDIHQGVLHKNDIKTDNRVENLYLGTQSDNVKDGFRNGRKSTIQNYVKRGESNKNSKLKEKDIYDIFKLKNKYTQKYIGYLYGIGQDQVSRILNKKRWKHLNINII